MIRALIKSRVVRYLFSGGTSAAVNLAITWFLDMLGVQYLVVVTIAFTVSLFVSFSMQKFLTFNTGDNSGIRGQFLVYTLIGIVNLLVNDLIVYIQVALLHMDILVLDEAIASIIVAVYSFFIYRNFIFKKKAVNPDSFVK